MGIQEGHKGGNCGVGYTVGPSFVERPAAVASHPTISEIS